MKRISKHGRAENATGKCREVFKPDALVNLKKDGGIGFASANALGPVGRETCHMGHCMIVDNQGVMRAQIPGTPILEHQQDRMVHARLNFAPRRTPFASDFDASG